jgi:hypothetical protein
MCSTMNSRVSVAQVHDRAAGYLQDFVRIKDHGPKCTSSTLISILFFAAAWRTSIHDACLRLRRAPSGQAARTALLATLPRIRGLQGRFNQAFASQVSKSLRKRPQRVVIDLTQIPYYGEPQRTRRELRYGKPKLGTTNFHTYATAFVLQHGQRFTLAMTYVWRDDSLTEVLQRLLDQLRKIGVRVRFLLLDREFYNLDVVAYLKSRHCPFLMPVVRRGRRPKDPAQAKGPWRFYAWKKSGFSRHTLQRGRRKSEVEICVARDNYAGRWGKHGIRILVYAFWGFRPGSPQWVRETYRKRFGIETGYRQMNQGRARTCSRDPVLRLLLVGIALLLRNVWVWFHLVYFARRTRGGGLQLHLELLRLRTLLLCLLHYAEEFLGSTETADTLLRLLQ